MLSCACEYDRDRCYRLGAIRDLADSLQASGRSLLLCAPANNLAIDEASDFERHVGGEYLREHYGSLQRAAEIYRMRQADQNADFRPNK